MKSNKLVCPHRNKLFLQESSDKEDSVSVASPVVLNKPPDPDAKHPSPVSAINYKNMAPSVCQTVGLQEASSEDKGITFTCQGSDVRKIVIHFGEKAASPKPSHLSNSDPNGVHCFPTPVESACTLETATEHNCSDKNRIETATTGAGSSSNRFGNTYSPSPIASQHSSMGPAAGETSYYDQQNRTPMTSLENVFEHYENMHCPQPCASHYSSVNTATEHGCYYDRLNSGTKVPVENDYLTPCEPEDFSMQSNKGEQRGGLTPLVSKGATATALSDYYIFADNTNRYDAESSEEEKYATII